MLQGVDGCHSETRGQVGAMQGRQKLHHLAAVVVPLLLSFCAVDDWLAGLEPDVDPALLLVRGSAVAEAGRAPLPAAN